MTKYRHIRVTSFALGISGTEHSVHQHKGANDFGTQAVSLGVTMSDLIGSTSVSLIEAWLKPFHDSCSADCTEALTDHVEDGSRERNFPC